MPAVRGLLEPGPPLPGGRASPRAQTFGHGGTNQGSRGRSPSRRSGLGNTPLPPPERRALLCRLCANPAGQSDALRSGRGACIRDSSVRRHPRASDLTFSACLNSFRESNSLVITTRLLRESCRLLPVLLRELQPLHRRPDCLAKGTGSRAAVHPHRDRH